MIRPPLESLMTKVDSRYTLVVAAAKRARQIMDAQQRAQEYGKSKPVTKALREIADGKITYARTTGSEG